jgi:hypothetical protein
MATKTPTEKKAIKGIKWTISAYTDGVPDPKKNFWNVYCVSIVSNPSKGIKADCTNVNGTENVMPAVIKLAKKQGIKIVY